MNFHHSTRQASVAGRDSIYIFIYLKKNRAVAASSYDCELDFQAKQNGWPGSVCLFSSFIVEDKWGGNPKKLGAPHWKEN